MTEALAPVASTAAATVSKIGMPSKSVPPRPGVTPATIWVPYSRQRRVWSCPVAPVIPWVRTRVVLSTSTDISTPPAPGVSSGGRRHGLAGAVEHVVGGDHVEPRFGEDLLPPLDVRPLHAHDERHAEADVARRLHHALGEDVTAEDAAEDIDED